MYAKNVTTCPVCGSKIPKFGNRSDQKFCSDRCKQVDYRKRKKAREKPIEALVSGSSADLIKEVAKLYASDPDIRIADVTYGSETFWKKTANLNVTGSDLLTVPDRPYDFRNLPYRNNQFDIVVLDPPYLPSVGQHMSDQRYKNSMTTPYMPYSEIRTLYRDGMRETTRVASRQVWVKCKDTVQAGQQCFLHIHVFQDAEELGLIGRDMFILNATSRSPNSRWSIQHHARKPMSYLWVFDVAQ